MTAVALVVHQQRRLAAELAHQVADWLAARGHEVRVPQPDADVVGLSKHGTTLADLAPGLDLVVSLGGDGTMLRAVEMVSHHGVPVVGVNVGRLGYLADVEPEAVESALERFLAGDYEIEERMMLAVSVDGAPGGPGGRTYWALNEVVAEKPSAGHTVHVSLSIDGRFFTTYAADGLIVATPTGSTAYAFSARGPIISPRQRALLITPVSPHMAFDRSLVLDGGESVRVEVIDDRPAMLTVDGREVGILERGDGLTCCPAPHNARFVTFGQRNFWGILKAKFGLADR